MITRHTQSKSQPRSWWKRFTQDYLWKIVVQLIATVIAFLPAIFYFGIKALLSPTGFWQELATAVLGVWFLGGLQVILLIGLAIMTIHLWLYE